MRKRLFTLLAGLSVLMVLLAACGGKKEESTPVPTPTVAPTAAPTFTPVSANTGRATPTPAPAGNAAHAGDAANGKAVFARSCSGCHSTGSGTLVGPGLAGIAERAGSTVPGLSAEEYIAQSIKAPGAYVVDGFQPLMPSFASLPDSDIQDLVAYLLTLK